MESMDRRDDVDWLRVFATYMLFPFHVAMVFNPAPFYHVRNDEPSMAALVFCGFVGLWHMPLFFILAGWSLARSLGRRSRGGVVRERLLRLGVPLVAGCVLLMPAIKWVELRSGLDANANGLFVAPHWQESFRTIIPGGLPELAEPFTGGFLEFVPTFFTNPLRFTWAHLWFVAYLLTFTLLYLPLIAWLAGARDRFRPRSRWWVYAPALPLALIQVVLRPYWPGLQNLIDDWANFAYYTTYLFCGVLLASQPALEELVRQEWRRALAVAAGVTAVLFAGVLGVFQVPAVMLAGSGIAGWCFVVAILGAGRTFLQWSSPLQRWLVESAFPVYLLHQSAIVLLGFWIVSLPLGLGAKLVLLLVGSVTVTLLVYELLVRRFALPRFLCGMKAEAPRAARARLRPATGALLVVLLSPSVAGSTPVGRWYAEGGAAQVSIEPCGEALCGTVVWLRSPFDDHGCALRDANNPDPSMRQRSVLGLKVLSALRPAAGDSASWVDGRIYDPGSGRTYRCTLRLLGDDHLELHGYVGVPLLGRTTHWLRVGREDAVCRASDVPG
jgi:uncharacterized protein (DUF2147 family)/peptidoglycan/LPS O-acetylase OafA/YrhL